MIFVDFPLQLQFVNCEEISKVRKVANNDFIFLFEKV